MAVGCRMVSEPEESALAALRGCRRSLLRAAGLVFVCLNQVGVGQSFLFMSVNENRRHNYNKKFWEELKYLLSLHKLTVDNIQCHHLHTKFHPNPPIGSKVAPTLEV
jgi:hypothetical protein